MQRLAPRRVAVIGLVALISTLGLLGLLGLPGYAAAATAANAKSPLGINLMQMNYYNPEQPFLNIFKTTGVTPIDTDRVVDTRRRDIGTPARRRTCSWMRMATPPLSPQVLPTLTRRRYLRR